MEANCLQNFIQGEYTIEGSRDFKHCAGCGGLWNYVCSLSVCGDQFPLVSTAYVSIQFKLCL